MPSASSKQPNSRKQQTDVTPPRRSRAREDVGEFEQGNLRKFAVNLHLFSTNLADAAAWKRGELPPRFPFGTCLWLLVALVGVAVG